MFWSLTQLLFKESRSYFTSFSREKKEIFFISIDPLFQSAKMRKLWHLCISGLLSFDYVFVQNNTIVEITKNTLIFQIRGSRLPVNKRLPFLRENRNAVAYPACISETPPGFDLNIKINISSCFG